MRDRQASNRVLLIPLRGSDNVIGKRHLSVLIGVKLGNTCAHAPQPPMMAYKDIQEGYVIEYTPYLKKISKRGRVMVAA